MRWHENDIVHPTALHRVGSYRVATYSLEDLVLGRIVRMLEEAGVHIRQIARVVRAVRGRPEPLSSFSWGASAKEVFVRFPDDTWHGGKHPTQGVMIETIDLEELRADTKRRVPRPQEMAGRTERRFGTQARREVFEGTRIPVDTVVRYLEAGKSTDQILSDYPSLFREDVEAVRARAVAG